MANSSPALSILTIPLFYLLAIFPHAHAISIASQGKPGTHDNRNPKGATYQEGLRKRLGPREYAAFERGESCHRNHLENMPLLIGTVVIGLLAEQKAGKGAVGLDVFCVGWMVARVLYTANYITTETQKWSYVRSLLYFIGTGWAFRTLWKAAFILGQ